MNKTNRIVAVGLATCAGGLFAATFAVAQDSRPAASAFDRLKALTGEWIDVDGAGGPKGNVLATYRITGGGSAVVETLFPGSPHEMTTVYHRDGNDLVLTHYCAAGNQPRMRARTVKGNLVAFEFDGGTHFNPATDMHMHEAQIEFLSANEIRAHWKAWDKGQPSPHSPNFRLQRKAS
jgi:hypothetical protein